MAVTLLRVLLLGVIAASADDVPVTWSSSERTFLPCVVPNARSVPHRRPPPPLKAEDQQEDRPYRWRRGHQDLDRISSNGTLEVLRKGGDGVYQCSVRHKGGWILGYPVNLKFTYLEKQFSLHPANETAWIGQPFVLSCEIGSEPRAVVTWQKGGVPLPDNNRYVLIDNQLLIAEVKAEDSGLYRCKATNTQLNKFRLSHGGRVYVEEPGPIDPSPVQLQYEAKILLPRGSRAVLPCPVRGNPKPKLVWKMTPPGDRTAELEQTDEVLIFETIETDHEGLYTCAFEGSNEPLKTFEVAVSMPVNITLPPVSRQSLLVSTVRFNCSATGHPQPTISWYKNGEKLNLTGKIEVRPSFEGKRDELLIRTVTSEDSGIYQCFANSGGSWASAWASLNVTGATMEPPEALWCNAVGANLVAVRWKHITYNKAVYTLYTSTQGQLKPGEPMDKTEVIKKLDDALTPAIFSVQAFQIENIENSDKNVARSISGLSNTVTCQGQGVPIKLAKITADEILVSWRQFSRNNPTVLEWILQYKPENSSTETNVTLAAHVTNYTLKVSLPETLQVRLLGTKTLPWLAQNLTLVPWSSTTVASDLLLGEVKAIPEYVEVTGVSAREFTVRWRCGEAEDSPQPYTFMVCTRKVDGNEDCQESAVYSLKVDNLQPSSQYEVRVQARLPERGPGKFSEPIHVSTRPEGAESYKDITYKLVNSSTLRVSWSSDPGQFTVRYSSEYSQPISQWAAVDTVGNTALLNGLDLSKELYVMVVGHEPFGQSTIFNIPAQVPEVKEIRHEWIPGGVRVSWRGDGPRLVRYSQNLTQSLDDWPTLQVSRPEVEILGLNPALMTYVTVTAPMPNQRSTVQTIPPRPPDNGTSYLGIGVACGVCLLGLLGLTAVCIWKQRKRSASPLRTRRRCTSIEINEEAEMTTIGGRLANGGGSKDVGEPLLNGHVHITENPNQTKTPNGKVRKGRRYEPAFDVSRFDDNDTTLETVIDPDTSTSTAYNFLDTSRRPEEVSRSSREISINNSFSKLPDDNMNSELTRSTDFELDNSKILPTLQPNG